MPSDEGRPICNRCKNGFFNCLGYTRPLVFLDETPSLQKDKSKPAPSTPHPSQSRRGKSNHGYKADAPVVVSYVNPQNEPLCNSLHLGAFKENILISHLLMKMSIEFSSSTSPGYNDDAPWMLHALQRSSSSSTPYTSILALAAAFFGRVNQEKTISDSGARTYGKALRQLKSDLEEAKKAEMYLSNTLSSLLLSIYELVACSHTSGWLQHFNGIGTLVSTALLAPNLPELICFSR